MKNKYLNELKEYLIDKDVKNEEINDILNDYESLIIEGLNEGLSIEVIIKRLGKPKEIYISLKDDLVYEKHYSNKITSLSVFIVLILFILSGMLFNLWTYNWLLFLLIPITSIITTNKWPYMVTSLSPFIATIIFFIFGMLYNIWHPLWLIFLLIPISAILTSKDSKNKLLGLSPFIATIVYISLGYINSNYYLYFWPIFLLIPIIGTSVIENKKVRIITLSLLLLSTLGYLFISFKTNNFAYPLFVFTIPIAYSIYTKEIEVHINLNFFKNKVLSFLLLLNVIIYLLFSLLVKDSWGYSWTILMFIPMLFIYSEQKFNHLVAYTPFLSLILFYLVGYFVNNGFKYSWLFFFLIPITAILFEKDSAVIKKETNKE